MEIPDDADDRDGPVGHGLPDGLVRGRPTEGLGPLFVEDERAVGVRGDVLLERPPGHDRDVEDPEEIVVGPQAAQGQALLGLEPRRVVIGPVDALSGDAGAGRRGQDRGMAEELALHRLVVLLHHPPGAEVDDEPLLLGEAEGLAPHVADLAGDEERPDDQGDGDGELGHDQGPPQTDALQPGPQAAFQDDGRTERRQEQGRVDAGRDPDEQGQPDEGGDDRRLEKQAFPSRAIPASPSKTGRTSEDDEARPGRARRRP